MRAPDVCCDTFAGYITVVHHAMDRVALGLIEEIKLGHVPGITHQTDMATALGQRGATLPAHFASQLHRLVVEDGQEVWQINQLWSGYNRRMFSDLAHGRISPAEVQAWTSPDGRLLIAPDFALSYGEADQPTFQMAKGTQAHYDRMIGLTYRLGSGAGVTVAVIDSGLDPGAGIAADPASRNYDDARHVRDIADTFGHGTAVASVIKHVAPAASVLVLKVGDRSPLSEWAVLSALLAADTQVINLSIGFSLNFLDCPKCGRRHNEQVCSAVFERIVNDVRRLRPDTIIAAAAGNQNKERLDYPSRFGEIVAIGSVDKQRARSVYGAQSGSNWGTATNTPALHNLVFFAPGGAKGEYVASTNIAGTVADWNGTSFAAPFASGLFALYLSNPGVPHDRASLLRYFQAAAEKNGGVTNLAAAGYGNGIISIA